MAPHSSTLAWKIPWTEEPGRLQSKGSLRVRHDWATSLSLFIFMHWRRKWQPSPVFLPGESQGRGEPGGLPSMGLHRVGHDWSDLEAAAATVLWMRSVTPTNDSSTDREQVSRRRLPMSLELWEGQSYFQRKGSQCGERALPMAKVMRKEAWHTQRRDQASGVSLEILEHLPLKPESAYFLLCAFTYTSDFTTGGCPPLPLSEKRVSLQLQLIIPGCDSVSTYKLLWKSSSLPE